jgi:predicted pyridoxine 5'-phosphate oxidase superfamily flavin-nucleotide-binding protein
VQTRHNSREVYAKVEARGSFRTAITHDLVQFLAAVDTAYLATATSSADGQPYAQHRGGPKGFIRVVDNGTGSRLGVRRLPQFVAMNRWLRRTSVRDQNQSAIVDGTTSWSSRSAPRLDHRICCDLFNRTFTRKLVVPSEMAAPTRNPARWRLA